MQEAFHKFALNVSKIMGSPWIFVCALLSILAWIVSGPIFNYSDAWQLTINTGTTIITFLMVFLIQNSQNRESAAMQLKLDELIRAASDARNDLVHLEEFPDSELERLQAEFRTIRERTAAKKDRKEDAAAAQSYQPNQPLKD